MGPTVTLFCLDKRQRVGDLLSDIIGNAIRSSRRILDHRLRIIRIAGKNGRIGDDHRGYWGQVYGWTERATGGTFGISRVLALYIRVGKIITEIKPAPYFMGAVQLYRISFVVRDRRGDDPILVKISERSIVGRAVGPTAEAQFMVLHPGIIVKDRTLPVRALAQGL